jgi:hypothetical protein
MTRFRKPATRLLLVLAVLSGALYAATVTLFTPDGTTPTGWVAEVDVSNFNFSRTSDADETLYKPDFNKVDWSGNLFAFPVSPEGTISTAAERWSGGAAAQLLDQVAGTGWDTNRRVVTMKKDGTKIPLRYESLEKGQQGKFGDATNGPLFIAYLRGDQSNEKPKGLKLFRKRTSVLGDIIHSRPLYVDDPDNPRVYVGANDGMLHAFDANTGDEVFAYMPSMFAVPFGTIDNLKADPYVHTFYVDATPNYAKDVTLSSTTGQKVLVGGLGGGGKGLYALNITDPVASYATTSETTIASKILWEITNTTVNNTADTSYQDLGHTYGVPLIAKVKSGTGTKWVAIVGNGYNNTQSAKAVLYVIDLATGAKVAGITAGTNGSDTSPNGLSSPSALDVDNDGTVDFVYAGDMYGTLWKFDLRSTSAGSWSALALYTTSPAQAITGAPSIALHPNGYSYMVNFGTGRIFTAADTTDTAKFYAYGVWDNDTPKDGSALKGTTIDNSKLVVQTLTQKTYSGTFSYTVRVSSSLPVDYTTKQGWKLELPAGERVVGDGGFIANGRYAFASTNPTKDNGSGMPKGENWLIEVDFATGGGGTEPFFDLNLDQQLTPADGVTPTDATNPATGTPVAKRITVGGVLSQPLLAQLTRLSETYFNTNPDVGVTTSTNDRGVSGGHFDFDIYFPWCTPSAGLSNVAPYKCAHNTHVHEYDDKYDVTGVDMQNASLAAFNLKNAIPAAPTKFKILMANQRWSPAVKFKVGAGDPDYIDVWKYLTPSDARGAPPTLNTSTNAFTKWLPTYSRNPINDTTVTKLDKLVINMPLDAFKEKTWDGVDSRVGLVPTQTGCVHANKGGFQGYVDANHNGAWMNGALTIQLIKYDTPDSAIELNVASDPKMGYRLKKDLTSQKYQLAEYTIFWHHPNGKCYGDTGWGTTQAIAYQDYAGSATAMTRAPYSTDPKDGTFGSSTGGTTTGGGTTGTGSTSGTSTTTTITLADGTVVTQTITTNTDGSVTVTLVGPDGTETFTLPPQTGGQEKDNRIKSGRLSWKELIRP